MKSLSALMLVLISAALLSLTTVAACSCQAREFPEHYCTSDVVLECMFTSRRTSQDKVIYNCRLDAVHKGNVTTRVIQVVTPKNGALCGVTFLTGCNAPTYLITGRLEVISAALNQKVVHVNLCNYVSDEPSDDVKEFLRNPSCPCSDRKCQPWQECRIYQHPNCLNITTDVRILKTDVNMISRDSEQLSGNLDVAAPVERCRESYCADTCKNFPCPTGQQCRLVDVNCFREPCPPVARCMPYDPCATILCLPNHECKVSDDGQPFCEPQCPECRPGYHCEKVQVFCVTSPCPPQYTCVKDDPVDPCNLTVSYGTAIDGVTDAEERYSFNKTARKCQKFYYNGVGGNDNQFATMAECEKVCPEVPPCRQPVEVGPCEAALPRWFYNSTSQQCEQFIYGGCRGNDNNFASQRQCDATCPAPSPCKLRADPGTCTGQVTAFHYSEDAGTCVAFNYSGCGGNANRFDSITACLQKCPPPSPCVQPLLHGVGNTIVERYYFDSTALMCKPFKFRGAGGNLNNFESLAECNRTCPAPNPCRLKPEQGPCRATFRRWYYDYQEGRCKRFIYGGCQGNRNNFETLAECQGVCPPVRVCHLPKVEGPCDARVPRWWYNRATKRCERFVYGGCDGNRNNFLSLAACQERCDEPCKPKEPCDLIRCRPHQKCRVYNYTGEPYCVDTCDGFPCKPGYSCKLRDVFCLSRAPCPPVATCVPDPVANDTCELDIVPGPCKAYIPRWAYDKETGVCRRFIYGGCGGNSNNFKTQAQCMQKCRPAGVCRLPIDEGPCDGVHARWAFDSKLGRCTQFNWGGCRGNRNRFLTQAACEQVCPAVPPCKQPKYSAKNDSVVCTAIVRYYYDKLSGSCKLYPADECPLNDNWFPDASTCESTCPVDSCKLNPDPGPCCDYQVRWYYDSQFGKCRRFRYGGCRGNSNNYESEEACMQGCHPDKCQLPVLVGRVDADDTREVRYAHNPKSGLCEAFLWGKIDDNANNFLTLDECEATCPPNPNECPGCSAGAGLVSTSVSLQTINPQYGFCCLPNTAHRGVCCCPAASDREASCVNGAQFFATHPGIDEADTVDLSAIENRFVPVPELYSTDDENM